MIVLNFLITWALLSLVLIGAVGYIICGQGEPTRRKLKARKVFFYLMIVPGVLVALVWVLTWITGMFRR